VKIYLCAIVLSLFIGSKIECREKILLESSKTVQSTKKSADLVEKKTNWKDFTYNSVEEKLFWQAIPEWPKVKTFELQRLGEKGVAIDEKSTDGYNGYAKCRHFIKNREVRTIYHFKNGWITRSKSWYHNGLQQSEINYFKGKRVSGEIWLENGKTITIDYDSISKPEKSEDAH
jgi:antitoxin component YwqK of YwqJK toxin-antitoxin module|tara:strand:+ start:506 stop:1027 length:522 start_codon:yes stop_codon:yes gene_type:complete